MVYISLHTNRGLFLSGETKTFQIILNKLIIYTLLIRIGVRQTTSVPVCKCLLHQQHPATTKHLRLHSNLFKTTTYKIRVTTGVKDNGAENSLSNVYETGTGFRPQLCFLLWWENQEPSSPLQME